MITVLLADDHAMVRDGLRYILEAAGDIQIIGLAADGKEAVRQALLHCPNIAVIDISMPVMDGIEATKQIAAACPHTRIITLSMYHTGEYVKRALKAGAFGYVLKDAAGNELIEAVRSLHAGKRYFSPQVAQYS
ncbi:MAG TPA: response regulator transcription factor [Anaerolineales bacterium]|jgi:DNA-binding NarL/FixJ family response regulator|nr:response regulator transcription factor [Anaerolineales bacterium]